MSTVRATSTILNFGVDKVTRAEAVQRCLEFIRSGQPHLVVTPNAEIAHLALHDRDLLAALAGADLVVADGAGVVLAARILGDPVPEKVAGVELADGILMAAPPDTRVFLLGATRESVAQAAVRLVERHPNVVVVGYRDGYWQHFEPAADAGVIRAVRAAAPHILFAGLGAPKQEKWLHRHLGELGVPLAVGIGGGIDLWAGLAERAPAWMRQYQLEWLYRIVRFRRFGRSLPPLLKFGLRVMARRLFGQVPESGRGRATTDPGPPAPPPRRPLP